MLSYVGELAKGPIAFLFVQAGNLAASHVNFITTAANGSLPGFAFSIATHYILPMGYLNGFSLPIIGKVSMGLDERDALTAGLRPEMVAINAAKLFAGDDLGAKFLADQADERADGNIEQMVRQINMKREALDDTEHNILYAFKAMQIAKLYEKVLKHTDNYKGRINTLNLQEFYRMTRINDVGRLLNMCSQFQNREEHQFGKSKDLESWLDSNMRSYLKLSAILLPTATLFSPSASVFALFGLSTLAFGCYTTTEALTQSEIKSYQLSYRNNREDFADIVKKLPQVQQAKFIG